MPCQFPEVRAGLLPATAVYPEGLSRQYVLWLEAEVIID